jgi:DNA polymerase zeta
MLSEILDTRVMVKKAMKEYPDNKSLLKLLDARQLSLKFIANVTYGYTCASFSGRMPGVEIADSIVLSARETLERSIRFVNENPKWDARVVYGDTDSMFVQLKGRTRQEAFDIGYDISETITRMNPRPVKLKFEKVYHPCFLVTKKRYVGSSYETPDQVEPIFDAKGIETIRRDGVPAIQKIMENCIKYVSRSLVLMLLSPEILNKC